MFYFFIMALTLTSLFLFFPVLIKTLCFNGVFFYDLRSPPQIKNEGVAKQKAQVKGVMHVKTEVGYGSSETMVSPVRAKKEKNVKITHLGSPFNFTSNFFSNVSVGYDVLLHTFQYLKVQVIT